MPTSNVKEKSTHPIEKSVFVNLANLTNLFYRETNVIRYSYQKVREMVGKVDRLASTPSDNANIGWQGWQGGWHY